MRSPGRLLLARVVPVLAALVLVAGCGSDQVAEGDLTGAVLTQPYVVPTTSLTDTSGQPYSLANSTDKRLTLVFFGYTNCPDICQIVMSNISSAMTRLDRADRKQVDVVFVTTDPQRDTEKVLRTYLDRFDPSFIGLTGDIATITAVGKPMAIAVEKGQKLPSGGYDVTHSTQVSGIDSSNEVSILWTQDTSAAELAGDVHTLLGSES